MHISAGSTAKILNALRRLRHESRGQMLVMFALVLPVLVGAMGLSIDIGSAMLTRTEAQKLQSLVNER